MLEKTQIIKETWIIPTPIGKIPFEVIAGIIRAIGISMLISLSYNIGVQNAQAYIMWVSYFKGVKVLDTSTGQTYLVDCQPALYGNRLDWKCENLTQSSPIPDRWQRSINITNLSGPEMNPLEWRNALTRENTSQKNITGQQIYGAPAGQMKYLNTSPT